MVNLRDLLPQPQQRRELAASRNISRLVYENEQAFREAQGRPTEQHGSNRVITVSSAAANLIRPLTARIGVRYGISMELLGRDARNANVFIGHPNDVVFDSMDLTLTGHEGVIDPAAEIPWVAQAQLVQKKNERFWKISGEAYDNDGSIDRKPTALPLISKEGLTEFDGGYIEKPWALFVNMEIFRVLGDSALPAFATDIRFQVTVNLISYAT